MKTQHDHRGRLSVGLSVIISRLLADESLEFKVLADEFSVSERTLQRDFRQRLIRLDPERRSGSYRFVRQTDRGHLPNTFTFIRNSGVSGIISAQDRKLIQLTASNSGVSPCLIGHGTLSSPVTQAACFLKLTRAIRNYRAVILLVSGKSYEVVVPHRLIFQSKDWSLVATRTRNL